MEFVHQTTFKHIYFDYDDRTVSCYTYQSKIPTTVVMEMTAKELEVSYLLMKELGWLDE